VSLKEGALGHWLAEYVFYKFKAPIFVHFANKNALNTFNFCCNC